MKIAWFDSFQVDSGSCARFSVTDIWDPGRANVQSVLRCTSGNATKLSVMERYWEVSWVFTPRAQRGGTRGMGDAGAE